MTGEDGKKGITEIFFCVNLQIFQGTKNTDSDSRKTPKKEGKSDKKSCYCNNRLGTSGDHHYVSAAIRLCWRIVWCLHQHLLLIIIIIIIIIVIIMVFIFQPLPSSLQFIILLSSSSVLLVLFGPNCLLLITVLILTSFLYLLHISFFPNLILIKMYI